MATCALPGFMRRKADVGLGQQAMTDACTLKSYRDLRRSRHGIGHSSGNSI
jgi:hypothetical protein